jgi:tetratricopeptide (TPR) repeat protein
VRHSLHSVFFDQAATHEAAGRYEAALALYYQAHRFAPHDPELWLRLGVLSFLTTDPAWLAVTGQEATHRGDMGAVNADVYLSRAVELAPDWAPGRFWRGWVRHRLFQDTQGARADLAQAIASAPRLAYAHAALARVAIADEPADAREAAASLERAIAALPESPRLHYDLGTCLARLDDRDGARQAFRRAMNAPGLSAPEGVGAGHLAATFHADADAIATLVQRYYADILT